MTRVEFVGGPRCGERRVIDDSPRMVRFQIKGGEYILYRRRPGRRARSGVVYYDFLPKVAA